jgi:hypothetical protein
MGGFIEIKHCEICGEGELQRPGAKYCKVCSPIYFRIKGQAGYKGAPTNLLIQAVKLMRGMKSRSPCGRKPKYLMKGRNL